MKRLHNIAQHYFWPILLLPAFFIIHVATENPELVRPAPSIKLWSIYVLVGVLMAFCFRLYFRNWPKAILMSFCVLCFQFFFGAVYDSLQTHFHGYFFSRYRFILSVVTIVLLFIAWRLKKSGSVFGGLFLYLNLLFVLLISADLITLLSVKRPNNRAPIESGNLLPVTGKKPDIYLIVADGYPGKAALQEYFRYNNDRFTDSLRRSGFFVNENAVSNYNHTTHSMASMLNLTYLSDIRNNVVDKKEVNRGLDLINQNIFTRYLIQNGYGIINHSIFTIHEIPAALNPGFLPTSSTIITNQTFTGRFLKDLVFQLAHIYHFKKLVRYFHSPVMEGNQALPAKTVIKAAEKDQPPRLVYTHLIMPHYPYLKDSSGNETDEFRWKEVRDSSRFISYLKHCNQQLLSLVSHIRQASARPPVILLIGDHGFREFNKPRFNPLQFSCLQAVYYPDGNYQSFYNGMSQVNLFRVLLNDQFGQQLPLLKDSSITLTDKTPFPH
ncbi:MAG TPA: hypothetical protein PLB49_09710 [Chitinophagaceae bacterium]|nr:hypothetical protein [Chitinophagaceae bacterium]HPH32118.1 hypothetical protein [Chitinophagaceae bacterium]